MEALSNVGKSIGLLGKIKSFFQAFMPTSLEIMGIDQELISDVLIHNYKFRVKKPRFSRSASKKPKPLNIPENLEVAEFRLELPQFRTRPVKIPASKINISAHDLIGNFLNEIHHGQEIDVSLRIPCSFKDIVEIEESRKENGKVYTIKNSNNFHLKSCDFKFRHLGKEPINEIQIIKRGTVISDKSLVTLKKTIRCDFEGCKIIDFFPTGITDSETAWFSHERTESITEFMFTINLEPNEQIEIRIYYRQVERSQND